MDEALQTRTPSTPPSDQSGHSPAVSCTLSSRDSSPERHLLSPTTSSSGIDQVFGTPPSGLGDKHVNAVLSRLLTMEHNRHNNTHSHSHNPFDSLPSLRNQPNRREDPRSPPTGPGGLEPSTPGTGVTTSSSPRNQGFRTTHHHDNIFTTSPPSTAVATSTPRNAIDNTPGVGSASSSGSGCATAGSTNNNNHLRNLNSPNWRNTLSTNIASSSSAASSSAAVEDGAASPSLADSIFFPPRRDFSLPQHTNSYNLPFRRLPTSMASSTPNTSLNGLVAAVGDGGVPGTAIDAKTASGVNTNFTHGNDIGGVANHPTIPAHNAVTAGNPANNQNGIEHEQANRNGLLNNSLMQAQIGQSLALVPHNQQQELAGNGNTSVAGPVTEMPTYAYCFDRGNGQYTRLIPADMLPSLIDIPARTEGCLGMTVLPIPTGLAPNGRSSNLERVLIQPPITLPSAVAQTRVGGQQGRDPVQSRIDNIVASIPAPEPQKRTKIYCDKWIHEGTCAFTQQGCKYKHEMPLDKETQESLGLFQGLPMWWQKHQEGVVADVKTSALALAGPVPSAGAPTRGRGTGRGGFCGTNRIRPGTWRPRGNSVSSAHGVPVGAGGIVHGGTQFVGGHGQGQVYGQQPHQQQGGFMSPFGPIAPPSAATRLAGNRPIIISNNPWNLLRPSSSGANQGSGGV